MNILQVVPELSAGGVERTVLEIAQALAVKGHTPHVASLGGRLEVELEAVGGMLHRLDMKSKNPLVWRANTKRLIQIIKTHKIDLVHARSRAPARSAANAARACGLPFVTTYHGIYNAKSGLKRRYNDVMARGDIVIANSQFTADHIMAEHGTARDKIVVVPRGVDMTRFDPVNVSADAVADIRAAWGIRAGRPCILLPGRLTGWKGQTVAIKALAELADLSAILVLLGDAQGREHYVAELWALAESLGVKERVRIPGHSADMPTAFMAANIVLSTSTDPEAFGRVAAEAQAMGRWVIASDHGGSRETVIEGQTGHRVPVGDSAALALAIDKALSSPPDTTASRAHIEVNFSDTLLKAAVLKVYSRLLAQKEG